MSDIHELVDQYLTGIQADNLTHALVEREKTMAEDLMVIGTRWAMFPEVVAEAMAEVGLGGPLDPVIREHIRANFILLVARIQHHQEEHPDEPFSH